MLNISQWQSLMHMITKYFDTSNLEEFTTEANPSSLNAAHVKFFTENSLTRVSLGIQSLDNHELKTLGRLHDDHQALSAMELVRNSGLVLSCDLIFGIPGQSMRTWDNSLKHVMQLANHISTYQLTLEPHTPLYHEFANDDLNSQGYYFYRYAQYILPRKNFTQYEISNFAPSGYECKHNISYWTHEDVIALGPSAVSYIDGVRTRDPGTLEEYLHAAKYNFPEELATCERLSPRESSIEHAILLLRTKWGIDKQKFSSQHGAELLREIEGIFSGMPSDLFANTPDRIILSQRGMRLGNSIWCEIMGM